MKENLDKELPRTIDNFLPEDIYKDLQNWVFNVPLDPDAAMDWGLHSYDGVTVEWPHHSRGYEHLFRDIEREKLMRKHNMFSESMNYMQKKIFNIFNNEILDTDEEIFELVSSAYCMNTGAGIMLHKDSGYDPTEHHERFGITFYLNDYWVPNWGGETIVYDGEPISGTESDWGWTVPPCDNCQPTHTFYPTGNRLFLVHPDKYHQVRPNIHKQVKRWTIQTFLSIRKIENTWKIDNTKPKIKGREWKTPDQHVIGNIEFRNVKDRKTITGEE